MEKSNWRKAIEKAHLEKAQEQVVEEKRREGNEKVRHSQEALRRAAEEARQTNQKETA
ncbi:MAG: hypothetical protein HYX22_03670 [Candidatus Yanofskybacteria bacterium]|nr:hypothetical protein [Candidatus Yanofskybacteria bacterium]